MIFCWGEGENVRSVRLVSCFAVSCNTQIHPFSWIFQSLQEANVHVNKILRTCTAQKIKFSYQGFFSVNVTESTISCGFGHIYWKIPHWKTSFFCAVLRLLGYFSTFFQVRKQFKIPVTEMCFRPYQNIYDGYRMQESLTISPINSVMGIQ